MSARKTPAQVLSGGGGAGGNQSFTAGPFPIASWKKPRRQQPIVKVWDNYGDWFWERYSPNHTYVACSGRSWPEKRHAVRAARSEARLTGARLVIDGEEVTV